MAASISKSIYGKTPEGHDVLLFTLENANGMKAKIINYGATLTELFVPDKNGKLEDIVLGFDNLEGYMKNDPYFGCTVGRVANRIANGKFSLEGKSYQLAINNGKNCLHGGLKAFHKVLWNAKTEEKKGNQSVILSYESKDGDEGFPGTLMVTVIYTLTKENELIISYVANTDKATPINLTNHSYFNLAGAKSGNILNHELFLNANQYTPANDELIPTGKLESVKGTLLDFTTPHKIGERIKQIKSDPVGYDHSYILNGKNELTLGARVTEPTSGRVMEVYTSEPSIQLYTSNFLNGTIKGKDGCAYQQYQGLCLETQHLPDSINQPNFPSIVLKPGEVYNHIAIHKFLAQ